MDEESGAAARLAHPTLEIIRFPLSLRPLRSLRFNLIGTGHWHWLHSAPPQVFVQPACAARTSPLQARNHVKQHITF